MVVVRRLAAQGKQVRAFVRRHQDAEQLRIPNVEVAFGDLRDAQSVYAACEGAETIIATANTVAPRERYSFADVEGIGYRNLIDSAEKKAVRDHGPRRIIFMSAPVTPLDDEVPTFRYKRLIEGMLMASKVPYTIVRGSLFMDDWFALMGSSIPLRGAQGHTLRRPFWFSRAFMAGAGHLIDNFGVALVAGSGKTRHAFIALDDVASFLVKAVDKPEARNAIVEIGGPQVLSWDDVVALFGKVLGKKVRALYAPVAVFQAQQALLGAFSPAAANLMGMNRIAGSVDTAYDMSALAPAWGVTLTSAEEFLRAKLET